MHIEVHRHVTVRMLEGPCQRTFRHFIMLEMGKHSPIVLSVSLFYFNQYV